MQELLEAGVHFGHRVSRSHPRMKPYIYGAKDGVSIIDLAHSEKLLKEASDAVYKLGKDGKVMLIVGTKKQAKELVESLAKEAGAPYITSHWIGGLLTNFDEIKRNITKLSSLKQEKLSGELKRYTKKEQLLISRRLEKFEQNLGGIADLNKIPDALFIVDAVIENTAVKEAKKMGIILIGFSDTNADPTNFDYPVPSNDDGIKALKIICETLIRSYGEGKKSASETARVETEKKKEEGDGAKLDGAVADEAAELEEVIEKKVLEESERKTE